MAVPIETDIVNVDRLKSPALNSTSVEEHMMDLVESHAHEPLKVASKNIGVKLTSLKKFLRNNNPPYMWAYRQISAIDSLLTRKLKRYDKQMLAILRLKMARKGKLALDDDGILCTDTLKSFLTHKYRKVKCLAKHRQSGTLQNKSRVKQNAPVLFRSKFDTPPEASFKRIPDITASLEKEKLEEELFINSIFL